MIALCITYQYYLGLIYLLDDAIRKEGAELSKAQYLAILKVRVVVSVLFWVCLYSVKGSFLLLYRIIFVVSNRFRFLWWSSTVFTIATFWVCLAGELTTCGPAHKLLNIGTSQKEYKIPIANGVALRRM